MIFIVGTKFNIYRLVNIIYDTLDMVGLIDTFGSRTKGAIILSFETYVILFHFIKANKNHIDIKKDGFSNV